VKLAAAVLVDAVLLCACSRGSVTSCADDLEGVWESDDQARWHILDDGHAIEIDPLFADGRAGAPRVADLKRTPSGDGLVGTMHRRHSQRDQACDSRATIRITACHERTLDLVVADPAPPLTFSPCTWGRSSPSRVEHWRRL